MIEKNNLFDMFLLLLIYFQLVIFEFFGLGNILTKLVVVLIVARLIMSKEDGLQVIKILLISLLGLYCLNVLVSKEFSLSNVKSNLLMQLYPLVYAIYIYYICKNNSRLVSRCMKKAVWLFNITMVINLGVLVIQIVRPYSVNAVITSTPIDFYEDTICGLFAYGSTHVLCLFTVFVIIYNLIYRKQMSNFYARTGMLIYIAFLVLVSMIIALKNDNKAFFLFLPIAIIVYVLCDEKIMVYSKFRRLYLVCICAVLGLPIAYFFVEPIRVLVDEKIFGIFRLMSRAATMGNQALGSSERIAIIGYALQKPNTFVLGDGFGTTHVYSVGYEGFAHFGQSDVSSLLVLGGIWYFVFVFLVYMIMMSGITNNNMKVRNKFVGMGIFILLFITVVYTQPFTRTNLITCLLMMFLALRFREGFEVKSDKR